jgi:hypothetical protein
LAIQIQASREPSIWNWLTTSRNRAPGVKPRRVKLAQVTVLQHFNAAHGHHAVVVVDAGATNVFDRGNELAESVGCLINGHEACR